MAEKSEVKKSVSYSWVEKKRAKKKPRKLGSLGAAGSFTKGIKVEKRIATRNQKGRCVEKPNRSRTSNVGQAQRKWLKNALLGGAPWAARKFGRKKQRTASRVEEEKKATVLDQGGERRRTDKKTPRNETKSGSRSGRELQTKGKKQAST